MVADGHEEVHASYDANKQRLAWIYSKRKVEEGSSNPMGGREVKTMHDFHLSGLLRGSKLLLW